MDVLKLLLSCLTGHPHIFDRLEQLEKENAELREDIAHIERVAKIPRRSAPHDVLCNRLAYIADECALWTEEDMDDD